MKKTYKTLLALSLLGLASGVLASCQSGDSSTPSNPGQLINDQADATVSYNIINDSKDFAYLEGLPEKGEAHKSYSFRVSLKPGYHFNDKLTITSSLGDVAFTLEDHFYTFEMPEADVTIALDLGQTDFTIKTDSKVITKIVKDDETPYDEAENVRSAIAGTALKFKAQSNEDFALTTITLNGTALEESEGFYHFVMPNRPVIIATDEIATPYNITFANELTLSTATLYTNEETKDAITQAAKGDKVFISFAHEVESVQYTVSVKTAVEEGEEAQELEVTSINDDLFSFEMVSNDVEITVAEKNISLYKNHLVLGSEEWHVYEEYTSSTTSKTKTYDGISDYKFKFDVDGQIQFYNYSWKSYEWTPNDTNPNLFSYLNGDIVVEGAVTEHIIAVQYTSYYASGANWSDVYFGLADDSHDLHVLTFAGGYKLVWVEDEEGNIAENILTTADKQVLVNVTVKNDQGLPALGSEVTKDSTFEIFDGETKVVSISKGAKVVVSQITADLAEHTALEIKDAAGNAITSSKNGETITIHASLTDDAPESLSLKTPVATYGSGSKLTLTAVQGQENTWTFVMPQDNVTVKTETKDMSKFANYPALGEYVAYNMYSSNNDDKDFSGNSFSKTYFTFDASGTLTKRAGSPTGTATELEVTAMDNAASGTMTISNGTRSDTVYFGDNIMVTPFTVGNAALTDVFIGFRLPEGATIAQLKNQVHFGIGSNDTWAVSFLIDDVVSSSIFCYKGTVYVGGVSFTFDEGSTRIGATSSYRVVKNGETLFDVSNNVVTPATAE